VSQQSELPIPHPGSTLSGAAHSPCLDPAGAAGEAEVAGLEAPPRAESPASSHPDPLSDALRYARMVNPYSPRRLSDALWQVVSGGNVVNAHMLRLQVDMPTTPEHWASELYALIDHLSYLSAAIDESVPRLEQMIEEADVQYERAVSAVRAIIAGFGAATDRREPGVGELRPHS